MNSRTKGQLSNLLKQLLAEHIAPADIRGGLAILRAKGLTPSQLPNCVEQHQNPPTSNGRRRRADTDHEQFLTMLDKSVRKAHQAARTIDGEVQR